MKHKYFGVMLLSATILMTAGAFTALIAREVTLHQAPDAVAAAARVVAPACASS